MAAETHPYTGTSFGPDGVAGSVTFSNLQSIAVDQASGNVLAYDAGDGGKVYKFNAAGEPVDFSALGSNAIEGVGGGGGQGEFEIAIAPAGSPGGTAGDIYVANNSNSLKIFSSAGEQLGEIAIGEETCGVAVDPSGHVFVGLYPSKIREYTPSASPVNAGDETGTSTATLPGICNVAADGLGNVYAANYSGSNLVKLEGLGDSSPQTVDPSAATMAVDPSGNDLYADRGNLFAQYDSSGNLIGTSGSGELQSSRGIAINSTSEEIYVGDGDTDEIDVFGAPTIVPGITVEAPSDVTGKKATLHASVNPDGVAVTDCQFEYGIDESYGTSVPCEGAIPTDNSDHPVTAALTGLTPDATYHFRVSATNANATARSGDQTFVTNPPAQTGVATAITASKATLNGTVFPEGEAVTDCFFEYGTTSEFGQTAPCEGAIPTDEAGHPVTASLTGLSSDTTYFFRLVMINATGTNEGTTGSFTAKQPAITLAATAVTGSKATLNGTVFPEGEAVTNCSFEYGANTGYGQSVPCEGAIPVDEGEHEVSAQLSHLTPNGTVYHFRLVITRASGTSRGADRSFTTTATVITGASSGVTDTTATVAGTLDPEGTLYIACAFEYGPTVAYGQSTPCAESPAEIGEGSGPVPVHADLTGLARGTTYHYRLVGTNADGVVRGNNSAFTTLGARVEAEWAEDVVLREATLKARINPQGAPTTYHLEYGTDTSYGSSTPERSVGDDEEGHIVTNRLEGLQPGTVYHYRFVATSAIGVSEGQDRTFTTFSPVTPGSDCPNQTFRSGFSAHLPDCRAYEMVSPVDKNNADIKSVCNTSCFRAQLNQGSIDGNKLTFGSYKAFGDALSSLYANQYLASRGAMGWTTHSLNPPRDEGLFNTPFSPLWDLEVQYKAFTPDLSTAWVTDDNVKPLTPDAVQENVNLYSRDNQTDSYAALTVGDHPRLSIAQGLYFEGLSADSETVVFTSPVPLTQEAEEVNLEGGLYAYSEGVLTLVSILPDGTPVGGHAGTGSEITEVEKEAQREGAVSSDGSRIFWSSGNDLYVRIDGERTVTVETEQPAYFRSASSDGSRMIFQTSKEPGAYSNLYEFDVNSETLTPIAHEMGGVAAASDDLSRIYFASREVLADGAVKGEDNLYLHDEGSLTLVAILSFKDIGTPYRIYPAVGSLAPINRATRVTPDGRYLVFQSNRSLTGYDNTDAINGEPDIEVYIYDADTDELSCVSCNPSGARPVGKPIRQPYTANEVLELDREGFVRVPAAAWIPSSESSLYSSRALAEDGSRLFFNSFDALVPRDTNGQQDVYEWVPLGSGDCQRTEGCVDLISSGESGERSEFIDADPDGENVFFETGSSLLPQDLGLIDIYDARVGGGFAPPPVPPAPCEGDACQSPPSPPNDSTPASATFAGAGSQVRKAARKHKRNARKKANARKRKRHAKQKRRANDNRRTAR